ANAHILTIQRISQFIDSPQRLTAVGNASTDDALFALVSG
ncbi:SgcA family PTS sugar transporter subunit IIA, partial [Escherichia coli]